jgi:ABC-type spermidine/putrescine transport system permease subunit II
MRTIGIITTVVGTAVAVFAAVVVVRSTPDIQRYLKIRSM